MIAIQNIEGENNTILIPSDKCVKTVVKIVGNNNKVEFGPNSVGKNLNISVAGSGNQVQVGDNCRLTGHILIKGKNQTVQIGDFTTFSSCYLLSQEGCDIEIGSHCMFSRGIEIRTSDAHSLIDRATGIRTNKPAPIKIGRHVWLSVNVFISKGVTIVDDCIVGAGASVFNDILQPHSVSVGSPAKVIRTGVTWNRERREQFSPEEMDSWMQPQETTIRLAS